MPGNTHIKDGFVSTPSARTLYADLLRLCARIGYSPPLSF
ncbi:capsid protein [Rhizobium terrae]|nr:capsid protein [Rhizobium terrae]